LRIILQDQLFQILNSLEIYLIQDKVMVLHQNMKLLLIHHYW